MMERIASSANRGGHGPAAADCMILLRGHGDGTRLRGPVTAVVRRRRLRATADGRAARNVRHHCRLRGPRVHRGRHDGVRLGGSRNRHRYRRGRGLRLDGRGVAGQVGRATDVLDCRPGDHARVVRSRFSRHAGCDRPHRGRLWRLRADVRRRFCVRPGSRLGVQDGGRLRIRRY